MSRVLVAYATRYGSTAEVAQEVGRRLDARGFQVDVRPAAEVRTLDGFDAVVLGAPFYIGSLLKDATAFLERHRSALERLPVALFTLGPLSAEEGLDEARGQVDEALAKIGWLKPVAAEMFVGKYDPAHLRLSDKLLAALPATPLHGVGPHDDRDWSAIDAWADALPV